MTSQAEDVLFLSLTDTDALEALASIGLDEQAIPTEEMRPVVAWALDRFHESGRTRAPSRVAMLETWGQVIEDAKVELLPEDEDADTIQWAISQLASQYVHAEFQTFLRAAGTEMAAASVPDRVDTLSLQADRLFALSQRFQPRHMQVEVKEGFRQALSSYEARHNEAYSHRGMIFNIPMIDQHTFGIHPGELALVAGGPKMGKSMFVDYIAKGVWTSQEPICLFTLENSVEMTVDRVVCQHLGINATRFQRGECTPEEVEKIRWFINDEMPKYDEFFHIIMPEPGKRTISAMVRQAQMLGARQIIIDQTSHVEHPDPGRKARHEIVGDILNELKILISTGAEPMSALMAHQINRAGVESARKVGHLYMEHLAESAYAERSSDWVFGLYQSADDRIAGEALLQVLAARRADIKAWKMIWQPAHGLIAASREVELAA